MVRGKTKRGSGVPLPLFDLGLACDSENYFEIVQVKVAPRAPAVFTVITVLPPTVDTVIFSFADTFQTPSSVSVSEVRSCVGSETERV